MFPAQAFTGEDSLGFRLNVRFLSCGSDSFLFLWWVCFNIIYLVSGVLFSCILLMCCSAFDVLFEQYLLLFLLFNVTKTLVLKSAASWLWWNLRYLNFSHHFVKCLWSRGPNKKTSMFNLCWLYLCCVDVKALLFCFWCKLFSSWLFFVFQFINWWMFSSLS